MDQPVPHPTSAQEGRPARPRPRVRAVTMLFWGALVVTLTLLALWPWALGILVVGPWLGHATWHAYRHAVTWDTEAATV